jgi:hypothetical protein
MFELHRFLYLFWGAGFRMMAIIEAKRGERHPFDFAGLIVQAA